MAAPTPTARGTPSGYSLKDGFRSLITLSHNTTISLWEISVKPIGADGGDAIDQTTMHNVTYMTKAPQRLIDLTDGSFKFAYDPAVKATILAELNREQTFTQLFSDGSTEAVFGFLKSVEFDELVKGTRPEGTAVFVPTNWDPTNKVEAGPVVTSVSGT